MSGSKLIPFLAAAAVSTAGEPAPLSQPEMQQILRALQTDFTPRGATGFEALNRLAIEGLLRAHPHLVQLVTLPAGELPEPPPLLEVSLTPAIACLRPHALRPADIDACRSALTKLSAGETRAVILDLRALSGDSAPATAAALAELFLPKGTELFSSPSLVKSASDPVWAKDLVVLVDQDSSNVAEIAAFVLQTAGRAPVAGSATRGRTAAIASLPVRTDAAGSLVLRYTAQAVTFPGGADPFGKGIVPDLPAAMEPRVKSEVFAVQAKDGLAGTLFHPPISHINEAALVAKINPELPARIARTAAKGVPAPAPLTDRPLQLAVDLLVARQVIDGTKSDGK